MDSMHTDFKAERAERPLSCSIHMDSPGIRRGYDCFTKSLRIYLDIANHLALQRM